MPPDAPVLARLPDADEALTAALGRALAAEMRAGDVMLLDGPLGAGKTHLARAFIRARLGSPAEDVPSPSFTLVQTYDADPPVWHVDLYRLGDPSETAELGLDEAGADIRLIEWPDRLPHPPEGALRVQIAPHDDPDRRSLTLRGDPARWPGIARAAERAAFTAAAGWAEAVPMPLAGDASARRYLRLLRPDGRTAVLMDAPPGSCGPYLAMTDWLRDRGFHAPAILAADPASGLLLLEDLGDDLLARVLEAEPQRAGAEYCRLADLLADLHRHEPPPGLLALDGAELAAQVGLFAQHYGPASGAPEGAGAGIPAAIRALHEALCADRPPVLGLRDCHAENIVVLGDNPFGLLDFQDAVTVHPAYDLVSALQDARRDIPADIEAAAVARYLDRTGLDPDRFAAAYALLGAQRNLRILGIFTRLCTDDGKPRYLAFMPRAWSLVQRNLRHPALRPLATAVAAFPPPSPEVIARIAARCRT